MSADAAADARVLSPRYGADATPLHTARTNRRPRRHRAGLARHRARPPSLRERWDRSRARRALVTASKNLVHGTTRRTRRAGLSKQRVRTALADAVGIPVAYAGIALLQGQPGLAAVNMAAIAALLPYYLLRGAKAGRMAQRASGGVDDIAHRVDELEGRVNQICPQPDQPSAADLAAGERQRLRDRTAPDVRPRHRATDSEREQRATREPRHHTP